MRAKRYEVVIGRTVVLSVFLFFILNALLATPLLAVSHGAASADESGVPANHPEDSNEPPTPSPATSADKLAFYFFNNFSNTNNAPGLKKITRSGASRTLAIFGTPVILNMSLWAGERLFARTIPERMPSKLALLHWTLAITDVALTCRNLALGGSEDFLPSQHCAGIASMIVGQTAAEEYIGNRLARHHPRAAKLIHLLGISDTVSALAYSKVQHAW